MLEQKQKEEQDDIVEIQFQDSYGGPLEQKKEDKANSFKRPNLSVSFNFLFGRRRNL